MASIVSMRMPCVRASMGRVEAAALEAAEPALEAAEPALEAAELAGRKGRAYSLKYSMSKPFQRSMHCCAMLRRCGWGGSESSPSRQWVSAADRGHIRQRCSFISTLLPSQTAAIMPQPLATALHMPAPPCCGACLLPSAPMKQPRYCLLPLEWKPAAMA